MNAPFFPNGAFGDLASLGVAFVIGIAFGFVLERAGFGSARKLVSQFYLDDMAVLKVMFTAIVVAMLGIWGLSAAGALDLSLVYFVPTHVVPEAVGGLLLGAGFVLGGWCPGTSLVGVVTGSLDALAFVGGLIVGTLLVGELDSVLRPFVDSGDLGTLTLPEALHLPQAVVVFAIVAIALGAFAAAGWLERRAAAARARA